MKNIKVSDDVQNVMQLQSGKG